LGAAGCALAAVLAACADDPPTVADLLADACAQARDDIAAAPAPGDADTDAEFVNISRQAASAVGRVAQDLADRGDDTTIADLAWQLHRFPEVANGGQSLAVAQEASAAIVRLDQFADRLQIPECGAATWRPADWRALADRHGDRLRASAFRLRMNRLCAETFPEPSLLAEGTPLLEALVPDANARAGSQDAAGGIRTELIARLNTLSDRQSHTAMFLRDFAEGQPQIRPFKNVESAVPRAMPRDPPPLVRERLGAAFDELQSTWDALDITCQPDQSGA
jgi:hypothetical protein